MFAVFDALIMFIVEALGKKVDPSDHQRRSSQQGKKVYFEKWKASFKHEAYLQVDGFLPRE